VTEFVLEFIRHILNLNIDVYWRIYEKRMRLHKRERRGET
jgi:hypothetical protein